MHTIIIMELHDQQFSNNISLISAKIKSFFSSVKYKNDNKKWSQNGPQFSN